MRPQPEDSAARYHGSGKLTGKVVFISGGDSGIGRAVAVAAAKEGADVAFLYREETEDANDMLALIPLRVNALSPLSAMLAGSPPARGRLNTLCRRG